jgi:DNA processing protein
MTHAPDYPCWIALAHLPRWPTEKINRLIVDIIHNKKISLQAFFALTPRDWLMDFAITADEATALSAAKGDLPKHAFLVEDLLAQGFQMIPINDKAYSPVLKKNLGMKYTPPLLYVKGNTKILHEPSVAIVGSRKASQKAIVFADSIVKTCTGQGKAVVSGFAQGVDQKALDASITYHGHSMIVLSQGVMTFGSGIKKVYSRIIEGDVLVLSTFHPKAAWDVASAMAGNVIIYGLAEEIYVAESDSSGGTWAGALDGLKKGRTIYVRKPDSNEKNGNQLLIDKGAVAVDKEGNIIYDEAMAETPPLLVQMTAPPVPPAPPSQPLPASEPADFEGCVIAYLKEADGPRTAREIKEALNIEGDTGSISKRLKKISAVKAEKNRQRLLIFTIAPDGPVQERLGL